MGKNNNNNDGGNGSKKLSLKLSKETLSSVTAGYWHRTTMRCHQGVTLWPIDMCSKLCSAQCY